MRYVNIYIALPTCAIIAVRSLCVARNFSFFFISISLAVLAHVGKEIMHADTSYTSNYDSLRVSGQVAVEN